MSKPIVIGILPQDKIRQRALAIARGEHKPGPDEPKIWFTSMDSLAGALGGDSRALIRAIEAGRNSGPAKPAKEVFTRLASKYRTQAAGKRR
ncbi:MAG: hypothetical protein AB1768_12685 [Pseudomonadota bacterium]|jgi:predicted transcriptional regulator